MQSGYMHIIAKIWEGLVKHLAWWALDGMSISKKASNVTGKTEISLKKVWKVVKYSKSCQIDYNG